MKIIILSAGQGRRLLPLTSQLPKAALDVNQRSVLGWQLHEIGQCAVDEVVVVTGFGAEHIDRITAEQDYVATRTLYNPFFAQCDNLGTLWVARHEITAPCMVLNGDTLFEAAILKRLLSSPMDAPIKLVTDTKAEYDSDDMKVIAAGERLLRVSKSLALDEVNAESIGMMRFDDTGAERMVAQIEYMMRYGTGLKQWYLSAIDALAQESMVNILRADGLSWCEIDDRADLEQAAEVVAHWRGATDASAAGR